jgi:uncharacterized protein YraI
VKRIATLTATGALVLGGTVLLAPSAQAATCTSYVVNANAVNLRTGPSTTYVAKGLLYKNDYVLKLKAASSTWWKVELDGTSRTGLKDGTTGYVAKKYLTSSPCFVLD